jgi:hypothetical protein
MPEALGQGYGNPTPNGEYSTDLLGDLVIARLEYGQRAELYVGMAMVPIATVTVDANNLMATVTNHTTGDSETILMRDGYLVVGTTEVKVYDCVGFINVDAKIQSQVTWSGVASNEPQVKKDHVVIERRGDWGNWRVVVS